MRGPSLDPHDLQNIPYAFTLCYHPTHLSWRGRGGRLSGRGDNHRRCRILPYFCWRLRIFAIKMVATTVVATRAGDYCTKAPDATGTAGESGLFEAFRSPVLSTLSSPLSSPSPSGSSFARVPSHLGLTAVSSITLLALQYLFAGFRVFLAVIEFRLEKSTTVGACGKHATGEDEPSTNVGHALPLVILGRPLSEATQAWLHHRMFNATLLVNPVKHSC